MTSPNLRVVDHMDDRPAPRQAGVDDLCKLSAPLTPMLTAEFNGARRYLHVTVEELLVASLARTIARTLGEGLLAVDIAAAGRALDPTDQVLLACVGPRTAPATEMVRAVRATLAALPEDTSVHPALPPSDLLFTYESVPARRPARLGHALELAASRRAGLVQLDWWYDARRIEQFTVDELAEQFPLALIELTSEAIPPIDATEIKAGRAVFALAQ